MSSPKESARQSGSHLSQQCPVLVLERPPAVVLNLIVDVVQDRIQFGNSERERPVAALPRELHQAQGPRLNPLRRSGFQSFDQFSDADCPMESNCQMNVVVRASDPATLEVQIPYDPCEVSM